MPDPPSEIHESARETGRAMRLIGEFMYFWAGLEAEINRGVHRLLGIRGVEGAIATANISVRDKLHILRTIVNYYGEGQSDWLSHANRTINAVGEEASARNTVAHNMFIPHKSGGVEFVVVKAKGKFGFPATIWSADTFKRHCDDMFDLEPKLEQIVSQAVVWRTAGRVRVTSVNAFALQKPIDGLGGLSQFVSPPLPLQETLRSPPANPKRAPQTRKAPPAKPKE